MVIIFAQRIGCYQLAGLSKSADILHMTGKRLSELALSALTLPVLRSPTHNFSCRRYPRLMNWPGADRIGRFAPLLGGHRQHKKKEHELPHNVVFDKPKLVIKNVL
ncbi:MAG: hypothetical protein EOO01_42455 [Chitinophagaceae bacterium]|nr:MAG: hypothetical protein EOO01_42455 [Chitinophagaceae bacterium]